MTPTTFREKRRDEAGLGRDAAFVGPGWGAVLLAAVVVGVLLGPLDLAGQVHTPYPFANLFNSPAVWATVAFFFGRWATNLIPGVIGGTVAMVVGVEMYYVADVVIRGSNTSNLWSQVALVWLVLGAGLVFGAAGALSTRTGTWTGAAAAATLPAVFAAEAAHAATRSSDGGWIVLLAALAVTTTLWLLRRADRTSVLRTIAFIGAWTALGFAAYLPFG